MEKTDTQIAINALNAARGKEMETNYVTAAIDALNTLLCSDISPRMASKIAKFRKVLADYGKQGGNQRVIAEMVNGAKDADGKEIADVYTV